MSIIKKIQKGFTLIELMVTVTIVGVLAAIAIPTYNGYVVRAQIVEGIEVADAVKISVVDYYQSNGGKMPGSNDAAGISNPPSNYETDIVKSVTVTAGGVIVVAFKSLGSGIPDGATIAFVPSVNKAETIKWSCKTSRTTLAKKFRPGVCR